MIDVSRYPLKAQKQQALSTRRIGLGITGLANLFVMLGITLRQSRITQACRKSHEIYYRYYMANLN